MSSESDLETVNFSDVEVEVLGNEVADAPLEDPPEETEQLEEEPPSLSTPPQTPRRLSMAARMAASRESKMKKAKDAAVEAKRKEEQRRKEEEERRHALEINAKRAQSAKKASKKKTSVPMPSEAIVVDESDNEFYNDFANGTQTEEMKIAVRETPTRGAKKRDVVSAVDDGRESMEIHELQKDRSNKAKKVVKRAAPKRKKAAKTANIEVEEVESEDVATRTGEVRQLVEEDSHHEFDPYQNEDSRGSSQRKEHPDSSPRIAKLPSPKQLPGTARVVSAKRKRRDVGTKGHKHDSGHVQDANKEVEGSVHKVQEQLHSVHEERMRMLNTGNGIHTPRNEEDVTEDEEEQTEEQALKDAETRRKREAELKKKQLSEERKKKSAERRKQREAESLRKKEEVARLKAMQTEKRRKADEERKTKGMPKDDDDDVFLAPRSTRGKKSGRVVNATDVEQAPIISPDKEPSAVTSALTKKKRGRPKKDQIEGEELVKKRKVGAKENSTPSALKEVLHESDHPHSFPADENAEVNMEVYTAIEEVGTPQKADAGKKMLDRGSNDAALLGTEQVPMRADSPESTPAAIAQEQLREFETEVSGKEKANIAPIKALAANGGTVPLAVAKDKARDGRPDGGHVHLASGRNGQEHNGVTEIGVTGESEPYDDGGDKGKKPASNQVQARLSDEDDLAPPRNTAVKSQQNAGSAPTDGQSHEEPASSPPLQNRALSSQQLSFERDETVLMKNMLDDLQTDDLEHVELQGERIDKSITKLMQRFKTRSKSMANIRRGGMSEVKQFLRRRKLADDIEAAKLALRTAQQEALVSFAEAVSASLRRAHQHENGALSDMVGMKVDIGCEGSNNSVERSTNPLHPKLNSRAQEGGREPTDAKRQNPDISLEKDAAGEGMYENEMNLELKEDVSKNAAKGSSERDPEIVETAAAMAHDMLGAANRTSQLQNADKGASEVKDGSRLPVLRTMQAVKGYIGTRYSSLDLNCPRSQAILMMCERHGGVPMEELFEALPFSKKVMESKLVELQKKGFLNGSYINRGNGSSRVFSTVNVADSS